MNYFLKNISKKIRVYYFYFIKKDTRQYFFVLLTRKILNIFSSKNKLLFDKKIIIAWCNKKKISEKIFYKKIGLKLPKNFFEREKKHYFSARLKEKKMSYKMGGMAHLNLIYNLCLYLKPKKILETGVAFGWSTLVFILSKPNNSQLLSVDLTYPTRSSDKFVAMALPNNLRNKFKLVSGIDTNYLRFLNKNKKLFNFIHYDSDKSYLGRKKNYELIWNILKKKGCFCSDDISDNSAFYEFVRIKKAKYYILKLNNKFVGVIYK